MKKIGTFLLFMWFFPGCVRSCDDDRVREIHLSGKTMGTVYSVIIAGGFSHHQVSDQDIKARIDARLEKINDIFSTYRHGSTISKFNRSTSTEYIAVETELASVVVKALEIASVTGGAFNITVDPLIDLWGFDKSGRITKRPDNNAIQAALALADVKKIEVLLASIKKADPRISINLSGIAKGFAVDEIGRLLGDMGFTNFMVEIGGEIVARGTKRKGQPWLIGIENPQAIGLHSELLATVSLKNRALASSGTYANFFIDGDKVYSHIIDPRSGYPIERSLVSVSVIASDCMTADALATSIMVMGEAESQKLLAEKNDIAVMMVSERDGKLIKSFIGDFERAVAP